MPVTATTPKGKHKRTRSQGPLHGAWAKTLGWKETRGEGSRGKATCISVNYPLGPLKPLSRSFFHRVPKLSLHEDFIHSTLELVGPPRKLGLFEIHVSPNQRQTQR